jgi:hypothetical protein
MWHQPIPTPERADTTRYLAFPMPEKLGPVQENPNSTLIHGRLPLVVPVHAPPGAWPGGKNIFNYFCR